jgi:hypothetical protein
VLAVVAQSPPPPSTWRAVSQDLQQFVLQSRV